MVDTVGQRLFTILDISNNTLQPGDICGMLLGSSCSRGASHVTNWTLNLPTLNLPPPSPPHTTPAWDSVKKKTKVLHISDLHVQLNYSIGSPSTCKYPLCCSKDLPRHPHHPRPARYWGEYMCDLAPWTLEAALANIASTHPDLEYVLLTGDLPAHDIWLQSEESNLGVIQLVASALKKHFPDIPVLPAIGNHEAFPVNMFPDPTIPDEESSSWLYSSMAKYFSHWLPEEQQKTMALAGYFSYKIKDDLTIISVNSNFCNNLNLWLLSSPRDPGSHLSWLVEELLLAEKTGSMVHIISHIPPGTHSCLGAWSHQYRRIIQRFSSTITAQFFGHTHWDEFSILYNTTISSSTTDPISMAYITPSMTPYDGLNPAYRVYYTDSDRPNSTHLVLDHATYILDLEQANTSPQNTSISFTLEYSARKTLGLKDLSPRSWSKFVMTLVREKAEWDSFYRRYSRGGPRAEKQCGKTCKTDILCKLVTFDREDMVNCDKIKKELNKIEKKKKVAEEDDKEEWSWIEDL